MRSVWHWTPRYIVNRADLYLYQLRHPDHPWLTKQAIWFLENLLRPIDVGFEWGSGRSTIWFAKRVSYITSVEHNPQWFNVVEENIKKAKLKNINLTLFGVNKQPTQDMIFDDDDNPYVKTIDNFPDGSLDFALVDGLYRILCVNRVINKIRMGGFLILDNSNWFLPCHSFSPRSKTFKTGPATPEWGTFLEKVKNWRHIWTSNGVTDTAIWLKI